jgi:hypothetical protein
LLHVRSLQAEQEQERKQAGTAKRTAMVSMVDTIEAETSKAIEQVSQHTTAMAALAVGLRDSATRTGTSAQSAARAAAQAQMNVQTVAGATEQFVSSSRENWLPGRSFHTDSQPRSASGVRDPVQTGYVGNTLDRARG